MSKYIDLVVVRHPNDDRDFVYQAPSWSDLKEDDEVVCEAEGMPLYGLVKKTCHADFDFHADEISVILYLAKAEMPLKRILSKVTYKEFEYSEDEDDTV